MAAGSGTASQRDTFSLTHLVLRQYPAQQGASTVNVQLRTQQASLPLLMLPGRHKRTARQPCQWACQHQHSVSQRSWLARLYSRRYHLHLHSPKKQMNLQYRWSLLYQWCLPSFQKGKP